MPTSRRFIDRLLDFSRGLVAGLSDLAARKVNYYRVAENVEPAPLGAHSVRRGTQRCTTAAFADEPHTLMEWVSTAGASNKYVGCKGSPGKLYRMTALAKTAQTTPYTLDATSWLSWCQLNNALVATEETGSHEPMFMSDTSAAETWLSIALPAPGAMTLTPGTVGGGGMAIGTYYYRLRWRYANGSSAASTPQAATLGVGQNKVDLSAIPVNPSGRTDYVGWTLERTRVGMTASGPFRFVSDGTATTHTDSLNDADLGYVSDDLIHGGFPDGHAVGLIPFKDRLFGWVGATLYASQAIGDEEATGIFNWDARNGFPFGTDDGEPIVSVVQSNDRLIVLKPWSVWALEGNDLTNFRVVQIYKGAGASGSRAASSMGGYVTFLGKAGLHSLSGNTVRPLGHVEVGQFLSPLLGSARITEAVVKNHLGQRLLVAFSGDGVRNSDMLVYDMRYSQWARWTGLYAQDILIQRAVSFGDNESFMYLDARDRDSGAGFDYRPMLGYIGQRDEKAADGTGGSSISVVVQTPEIGGGAPDVVKLLRRIEVFAHGSGCTLTVTVTAYPSGASQTITLAVPSTAARWGSGTWGGGGVWGSGSENQSRVSGLRDRLHGKRYDVRMAALVPADLTFKGFALDGIAKPERSL